MRAALEAFHAAGGDVSLVWCTPRPYRPTSTAVGGHVIGSKTFRALRHQDLLEPTEQGAYRLTHRGLWVIGQLHPDHYKLPHIYLGRVSKEARKRELARPFPWVGAVGLDEDH